MGYGTLRLSGETELRNFLYGEVQGESYRLYIDYAGYPQERSTHEYTAQLDPTSGTWTFYLDSYKYTFPQGDVQPQVKWADSLGRNVGWIAEILNRNDDMVGTSSDPCVFSRMRFKSLPANDWDTIGFLGTDLFIQSDPISEWGIDWADNLTEDSLFIWDVKPR